MWFSGGGLTEGRHSLVVERLSSKQEVVSSILTGAYPNILDPFPVPTLKSLMKNYLFSQKKAIWFRCSSFGKWDDDLALIKKIDRWRSCLANNPQTFKIIHIIHSSRLSDLPPYLSPSINHITYKNRVSNCLLW